MKWTVVLAIVGIITLEVIALIKGVNGTALSLAIGGIAGLGGYQVKKIKDKIKGGKK